jgi:hypothetical protein
MRTIDELNQIKRTSEVYVTVFSILAFLTFTAGAILFSLEILMVATFIAAIFVISLIFLIAFAVKFYKLKKEYAEYVKVQVKKLPYVLKHEPLIRVKKVKDLRELYLFPRLSYYTKRHALDVEYRHYTFSVHDGYAVSQDGNASTTIFKGKVYEFTLEDSYPHMVITTNKRVKPKNMGEPYTYNGFRIFGIRKNIEDLPLRQTLKSLTIVLKGHKAYIALEKKWLLFEFSAFVKVNDLNLITLMRKTEEEFDEVIDILEYIK